MNLSISNSLQYTFFGFIYFKNEILNKSTVQKHIQIKFSDHKHVHFTNGMPVNIVILCLKKWGMWCDNHIDLKRIIYCFIYKVNTVYNSPR